MKNALLLLLTVLFVAAPPARLHGADTVVYKKVGARELKLFLVKPDDWKATDQRPALVFFHGGGRVGGAPTQFTEQPAYLAFVWGAIQ